MPWAKAGAEMAKSVAARIAVFVIFIGWSYISVACWKQEYHIELYVCEKSCTWRVSMVEMMLIVFMTIAHDGFIIAALA